MVVGGGNRDGPLQILIWVADARLAMNRGLIGGGGARGVGFFLERRKPPGTPPTHSPHTIG